MARALLAALCCLSARTTEAQDFGNIVFIGSGGVSLSAGAGARAFGMGGAFIAVADDATASSWNPAGLAVLERPEASLVWKVNERQVAAYSPKTTVYESVSQSAAFSDSGSVYSIRGRGFDFFSVTWPFRLGRAKLVPQVSLQKAIERGFEQRPLKDIVRTGRVRRNGVSGAGASDETFTFTQSVDSDGGFGIAAFSLAANVGDRFFAGIAINRWTQDTAGTLSGAESFSSCSDAAAPALASCDHIRTTTLLGFRAMSRGYNANLGLLYKVSRKLRLGAVLKTPFTLKMDIEESSTAESVARRIVAGRQVTFGSVTTRQVTESGEVRWPLTVGAGVALAPRDSLTVATDLTVTSWSGATYTASREDESLRSGAAADGALVHERVVTETDRVLLWPTLLDPRGSPPGGDRLRNQIDSFQVTAGVEYVLVRSKIVVPLRTGAFVDQRYFTDGRGGRVRFWGWSVGIGATFSAVSLDLAYVNRRGSFSTDFNEDASADIIRQFQASTRDDRFISHRFYASTIARF